MNWFWDWGYLIVTALTLIGSFIIAGKRTKDYKVKIGMYTWAVMFSVIMLTVFSTEAISYWLLPQRMTISNVFGVYIADNPIWGFIILTAFLGFSWSLVAHLVTRKWFGDNK